MLRSGRPMLETMMNEPDDTGGGGMGGVIVSLVIVFVTMFVTLGFAGYW
jgi:hypothetical protein